MTNFIDTLTPLARDAVARWTDPERRPLFKGNLVDFSNDTGGPPGSATGPCMCAQGDVLVHDGFTPEMLKDFAQQEADRLVAEKLGISRAHAVLLRIVNDRATGCPQDVLTNPENVLGVPAHKVLGLWRTFDARTGKEWLALKKDAAAYAAYAAYAADAYAAAAAAAAAYAADAAAAAADAAAAYAAAAYDRYNFYRLFRGATNEVIGHEVLAERGKKLSFLSMLGYATIEDVPSILD